MPRTIDPKIAPPFGSGRRGRVAMRIQAWLVLVACCVVSIALAQGSPPDRYRARATPAPGAPRTAACTCASMTKARSRPSSPAMASGFAAASSPARGAARRCCSTPAKCWPGPRLDTRHPARRHRHAAVHAAADGTRAVRAHGGGTAQRGGRRRRLRLAGRCQAAPCQHRQQQRQRIDLLVLPQRPIPPHLAVAVRRQHAGRDRGSWRLAPERHAGAVAVALGQRSADPAPRLRTKIESTAETTSWALRVAEETRHGHARGICFARDGLRARRAADAAAADRCRRVVVRARLPALRARAHRRQRRRHQRGHASSSSTSRRSGRASSLPCSARPCWCRRWPTRCGWNARRLRCRRSRPRFGRLVRAGGHGRRAPDDHRRHVDRRGHGEPAARRGRAWRDICALPTACPSC